MSDDTQLDCECEHDSHFFPGMEHVYGGAITGKAVAVQTDYGTFIVCRDCADHHLLSPKQVIQWDRPMLVRFKATYNKEKGRGERGVFHFESHAFVVGYAKYLIQYLDAHLE